MARLKVRDQKIPGYNFPMIYRSRTSQCWRECPISWTFIFWYLSLNISVHWNDPFLEFCFMFLLVTRTLSRFTTLFLLVLQSIPPSPRARKWCLKCSCLPPPPRFTFTSHSSRLSPSVGTSLYGTLTVPPLPIHPPTPFSAWCREKTSSTCYSIRQDRQSQ